MQCKSFCNHEGTRLEVESKAQGRQSRKMEPAPVLEDTAEPLQLHPPGFSHEIMRCLKATAAFIPLFHNLQPKTFRLHFPGKFKTSISVLPNAHFQSWFLGLYSLSWELGHKSTSFPAMYLLRGLGKVTKPLWSQILMHKNMLIHFLFTF